MTHQPVTDGESASEDAKAVLFCPTCRYRGKWTDWCAGDGGHALRCPSCGATIG